MTRIAGIDVGNSTTEIVITDDEGRPLAWDRAPTRGLKGSMEAAHAAATLLRRLQRRSGHAVEQIVLTHQVPVLTFPVTVSAAPIPLGVIRVIGLGSATPGGAGYAVGRPVPVEETPDGRSAPVILVARDRVGFRATVARVTAWQEAGAAVVGVVLAGDEAVLVASRLGPDVPVIDSVDVESALQCTVLALEVAPAGAPLAALTDPIRLAHDLGLDVSQIAHAGAAAAQLRGHRSAVIGRLPSAPAPIGGGSPDHVTLADGDHVSLPDLLPRLRSSPVGCVRTLALAGGAPQSIDDAWGVDLAELDGLPGLRAGDLTGTGIVLATLAGQQDLPDPRAAFTDHWADVEVISSEWEASRLGALSTPGAPGDAWVIDLGGGTLDAVHPAGHAVVAAGCGDLLTVAVARALGLSTGAAEWVKRSPASHVDAPHVMTDESGERRFLTDAAPTGSVGWLVVDGPSGPLPFTRTVDLSQWSAVRLHLKHRAIADNLARALASFPDRPERVLIQGGPGGDAELLQSLNRVLPGITVGRSDVAGSLGHRWAVAYGLVRAWLRTHGT